MQRAQEVDLVVRGGFVLTMDDATRTFFPGSVAVQGTRIVAVDRTDVVDERYHGRQVVQAAGHVVMPGFVNAHTHLGMGYLRGMADDMKLYDWMTKVTRPTKRFAAAADNHVHALLGCLESIKGGVTALADNIDHLGATVDAVTQAGVRAMVSPYIIDNNNPSRAAALLEESAGYCEQFSRAADGRVRYTYSVHAPYSCSTELLRGVRELADRDHAGIQIHLAESRDEQRDIAECYGMSPTRYCDSIGFLGPDVLAAHYVWADDADIEIVAQRGVKISHNPASNLKLASGFCPLPRLLETGVTVGLGTDSCVSNNRLDLFETMKLAALIHKATTLDPLVTPAPQILAMATRLGAQAIGLGDEIGSLQVGKKADLILVDFAGSPHLTPHFFETPRNIVSHLVYAAQSSDVRTVIVDGRLLMEDRQVRTVDEKHLLEESQARARSLLTRAGIL